MILAHVMDHRVMTAKSACAIEPLDRALARVHELAAVYWDRDGMSLDGHLLDYVVVGLWNPSEIHDGSHGCVVLQIEHGTFQIAFTGDLAWVRENDRSLSGDFYHKRRWGRIAGEDP